MTFDASASAIGYLHQVRWGLYELLVSARRRQDQTLRMTLEAYDDVTLLDASGAPLRAVQVKHHGSQTTLTDNSKDLWGTLRVWLETPALAVEDGPLLTLATTGTVKSDSAASFLGSDSHTRNVTRAHALLDEAASHGGDSTKAGRKAWLDAPPSLRSALLARVHVAGQQANIAELDGLMDAELVVFVAERHLPEFKNRLWGWWESQAVSILQANIARDRILYVTADALSAQMRYIRDDLTADALTVDMTLQFDEAEIAAGHDEKFVQQLRLVNVSEENIRNAVGDYLRAYAHTTRWVINGDLFDDDVTYFKDALKAEWRLKFHEMLEDLESDGIDDDKERSRRGRDLFRVLNNSVDVKVRPEFTASFHARGTRNGIASEGDHGWHPDYRTLLAGIFSEAV